MHSLLPMYAPLGTTAVMQDFIAKNTQKGPEIKPESFFFAVKVKQLWHMKLPLEYFTLNVFDLGITFCSTFTVIQSHGDNCSAILSTINMLMEIKVLT